jgi:hypothetical protein
VLKGLVGRVSRDARHFQVEGNIVRQGNCLKDTRQGLPKVEAVYIHGKRIKVRKNERLADKKYEITQLQRQLIRDLEGLCGVESRKRSLSFDGG